MPPSFDTLVARAGTIFVGEVIDQRAVWITTALGRAIRTRVVFRVEDVWKGSAGVVTQLEFLGGTIGPVTMEVTGMPVFSLGQRSVLFVAPSRQISPLVGFMHGRMRVQRDSLGIDRVMTNDGRAVDASFDISPQRLRPLTAARAVRLADLEYAVKARVAAAAASPGRLR